MNKNKQGEIDLYQDLIDQSDQIYDVASIDNDTLNELVCECHVVSFEELVDFVKSKKCVDLGQISHELKVGTGCHSCLRSCGSWIKRLEKVI